ncbi:Hypothetical protein CINCED_3A007536, partial [Cinara cedri]
MVSGKLIIIIYLTILNFDNSRAIRKSCKETLHDNSATKTHVWYSAKKGHTIEQINAKYRGLVRVYMMFLNEMSENIAPTPCYEALSECPIFLRRTFPKLYTNFEDKGRRHWTTVRKLKKEKIAQCD